MEVHIPSDADTTAVRIEGSQEGVASAKAELLELVDKMVSSSSGTCSSSSCSSSSSSREGVASAKAELLELVDKMVSSSSSGSSSSCCSCSCIVIVVVGLVLAVGGKGQCSK